VLPAPDVAPSPDRCTHTVTHHNITAMSMYWVSVCDSHQAASDNDIHVSDPVHSFVTDTAITV